MPRSYRSTMASPARFTSLMAFSPDQRRGIGLHYTQGQVSIGLTVEWRQETQKEQAIRRLFASFPGATPD